MVARSQLLLDGEEVEEEVECNEEKVECNEEEEHKKKKEEEEAALQLEWPVTPAPPQRWHQVREEQAASVIFEVIEHLISSELLASVAQLNHVL